MNREEMKKKIGQEGVHGVDDSSENLQNQSRLFGCIGFSLVYIVITSVSLFTQTGTDQTANAMFIAFITGEFFIYWRAKRSLMMLIFFISGVITTIGVTASVIMEMSGK